VIERFVAPRLRSRAACAYTCNAQHIMRT
jgi:hypothetical protein